MGGEASGDRTEAHWTIRVTGDVQGVFYRAGARDEALRLGLAGEARNMPDRSVLIEVEGPRGALEQFRLWCQDGPPRARVEAVEVSESASQGLRGFTRS